MTTDKQKEARERLLEMAKTLGIRMVDDVESTVDPTLPMGADVATWDKLTKPKPQYDEHGNLKKPVIPKTCRINTNIILENDPKYSDLVFWEHADQVLWRGSMVSDAVIEEMALDMEIRYRYTVGNKSLEGAVLRVANTRIHTPIKDWLESLPAWDGVGRIENLAEKVLNCETLDEYRPLIQRMSALMWIAFVARIYDPGCHVHTMPIMVGPKGVGKSMLMEIMAGEYFTRADLPIGKKDALEKIHQAGMWVWELAELKDLQGKSADVAKQFITTSEDLYRPSYGKLPVKRKRRTCFVGSTNNYQFMDDGPERRFWIFKILKKINLQYLQTHRVQIWCEAIYYYKQGVKWWLDEEYEEVLKDYQTAYLVDDPWAYKVNKIMMDRDEGTIDTSTSDIVEAMDIPLHISHTGNAKRIAAIMAQLGYESKRRGSRRVWKKSK
jgi:predicted P-loop ATPase